MGGRGRRCGFVSIYFMLIGDYSLLVGRGRLNLVRVNRKWAISGPSFR